QYRGVFEWYYPNPDTGATTLGQVQCKVILLVGTGSQALPSGVPDPSQSDPQLPDEPQSGDIVVTEKTKTIVIGVGCAVLALILAGFVGFYYIRYSNRRAAEEQINKKLREPIQSGPLFPPTDRGHGAAARYNELASVTTSSMTSPAISTSRTEMVELGGSAGNRYSPALGSRSPTPIAAAHAKQSATPSNLSASQSFNNERPGSLLTSSFIPVEEGRNPFEQRDNQQYEHELHLQQQHQLQLQQQQQQQQQNYGSYPY
ncbi:hypothetical protein BGX26_005107, partial [Mortierella sp. AD094]